MISAANDKKDDRSSEDDETKIMRKGAKIMDKLEKVEKAVRQRMRDRAKRQG